MNFLKFMWVSAFVLSGLVRAPAVMAQTQVTWIVEKFEPYYILEGPLKGQGAADRLVRMLQQEMPELQHATEFMPILRIREALKAKEHVVSIAFLKDPSLSDYVQYSAATMLVPALELTLRRDDWEKQWGHTKAISAAQFMRSGGVIGIADGRHYGEKLDVLLSDKKNFGDATYARAGNHYRGLAEMVSTRNIDATIGYSAELRYLQRLHPEMSSLVSVAMTENTRSLYAYAIMPQGKWGDQFRLRINRALIKLRATPQYKQAITDWFGQSAAWDTEYQTWFLSGRKDSSTAGW